MNSHKIEFVLKLPREEWTRYGSSVEMSNFGRIKYNKVQVRWDAKNGVIWKDKKFYLMVNGNEILIK